ncbi:MAG: hypothetical protein NVS1B5_06080 [Gemmatimonadaceae bacterium]
MAVASGWPELSTRTNEWQRASPAAALGQTLAWTKRIDKPAFALNDALGPVIAVGGLSGEHAANAATAPMLSSVRAWSNIMVFSKWKNGPAQPHILSVIRGTESTQRSLRVNESPFR